MWKARNDLLSFCDGNIAGNLEKKNLRPRARLWDTALKFSFFPVLQITSADHLDILTLKPRANGRNNSQQYKDVQCIMGTIRTIRLVSLQNSAAIFFSTCYCMAISMETVCNARACPQQCWKRRANSPTLLHYASAITEQN